MTNGKTIGDKIKQGRTKKKLTQEDLAKLLNVSRSAISGWEVGRNYPDLETVVILSDLFNISLDELLREDLEMREKLSFDSDEKKQAHQLINSLTTGWRITILILTQLLMNFWISPKINDFSMEIIVNIALIFTSIILGSLLLKRINKIPQK